MTKDKTQPAAPATDKAVAVRFFTKWGLISLAVLVALVVAESLLVELQPTAPGANDEVSPRQNVPPPASLTGSVGLTFPSYSKFMEYQEALGYIFLGRRQDRWPARIIDEQTSMNAISFELSGGKNVYPGFDGYELKVVRLATDDGHEGIIVLRSAEKRVP